MRQRTEKSIELKENYLRRQGPRWAEDEELRLMVQGFRQSFQTYRSVIRENIEN